METRDKKITVVGMARSGIGAANLLCDMGAAVTATDLKTEADLVKDIQRLDPRVKMVLGEHPESLFAGADLVVVSPGVPLDIKPLQAALSAGVPVIGELELASRIIRTSGSDLAAAPFLAVTGSNGKSTTTTLLALMLQTGGSRTVVGGNIGNALSEEVIALRRNKSDRVDYFIVEVSSFQLEAIDTFRPHVAAILNITPDHMDRYHSMDEYGAAKVRISMNQKAEDFLVVNADDHETGKILNSRVRAGRDIPRIVYFSRIKKVEGIFLRNGILVCNMPGLLPENISGEIIAAGEIRIKGVHNLENAMAASAMALLAGCPLRAVIKALKEFGGLEHRLEFVRELEGVQYINDSKGTNVGAVVKSLESFDRPLILIAGGRDKAGDFAALRELVAGRVKALVLIGEAAGKIRDALQGVSRTVMAGSLQEAVSIARSLAESGDVVLLSPACASFDMFRDFEDRGRQFKKAVMGLEAHA